MKRDYELNAMIDKRADEIVAIYDDLSNEATVILEKVIEEEKITQAKKTVAIASITALLAGYLDKTNSLLSEHIPAVYLYEANKVSISVGVSTTLKPIHTEFVNQYIEEASVNFGQGLQGVTKSAGQMLSDVLKAQITADMNKTITENKLTLEKLKTDTLKRLKEKGFTTFYDKRGRQMNLSSYSRMLSHTHMMRTANNAVIQRGLELGVTIYEMSSHGNIPDEACRIIDGKFFDITGNKHPKPPDMPIHPNCRHVLSARPDL